MVSSDLLRRAAPAPKRDVEARIDEVPGPSDAKSLDDTWGDFLSEMVEEHLEQQDMLMMPSTYSPISNSATTKASPAKHSPGDDDEPTEIESDSVHTPACVPGPVAETAKPAEAVLNAATRPHPHPALSADPSSPAKAPCNVPASFDFLRPDPARPFIAVREVRITGVTLAFRESDLRHPAFRLSFPQRCVFSGHEAEEAGSALVARPMIFINHHRDGDEGARNIELKYETHFNPGSDLATIASAIDRIEGIADPFDLPLLYFATRDFFDAAMACTAFRPSASWGYCEVTVPCAEVALEWLARVNGICDPAYDKLRQQVNRLSVEGWNRLSDQVRTRIGVWCRFATGEDFLAYARDADFPANDAGLAGIVATNKRLVCNRFRNTQSLPFENLRKVRVLTSGGLMKMTLTLRTGAEQKLNPISRSEAPLLFEAIENAAPHLEIEVRSE